MTDAPKRRGRPSLGKVQVTIRLKADTLAMIDAARGEASRADYIENALTATQRHNAKVDQASAPIRERAVFGSRLKKVK